jgi:Tol biopolymer transport system component
LKLRDFLFIVGLTIVTLIIAACQNQPNQIFIEVDGRRQALTTDAATVREALDQADIVLSPLDRVSPDLYAKLEPGLVIVVVRVIEEIETQREIIPFERQTVVNEALARGETRLAQLGVNGEDEISIRVVYEDGKEVSRTEISRTTIIEPAPEILVIGPQDTLPPVPVEGTIAYLSNGNAWIMRNSSSGRRALTTGGDLDERVFALSQGGRQLLYTTHLTDNIELPLNEMWLASTTIVGEKPISLGIQGVLQAEWSPVVSQSLVVYSTAERTANPPGWRANNDLWLLNLEDSSPRPVEILAPNTAGLYPWWGTTFTWSPDGTALAYARADQAGIINLSGRAKLDAGEDIIPLVDFSSFQTFSDWVWTPHISWSPDSQFIVLTLHGPPLAEEPAEESQVFDLWLIGRDGNLSVQVGEQVGMWANPAWGKAGIAYGAAMTPLQSVNSRYAIYLMDRDGSNKRRIFPYQEELGVQYPELAWSPDGEDLLFIYNGNLYLTGSGGGLPKQLSTDGQASHPRWSLDQSTTLTTTLALSSTGTVSGAQVMTGSTGITVTTGISSPGQPPTATPTALIEDLPTPTPTSTISPNSSATAGAETTPESPGPELTTTPGPPGSTDIEPTDPMTAPVNTEDSAP